MIIDEFDLSDFDVLTLSRQLVDFQAVSKRRKQQIRQSKKRLGWQLTIRSGLNNELHIDESNDLLAYGPYMHYGWVAETGKLFLTSWAGNDVYLFDVDKNSIEPIAKLNRSDDDDRGYYRVSYKDLNDKCLIIYEGGFICINKDGHVQWEQTHPYGIFFERISEGVIYFEHYNDGPFCYQLSDGAEIVLSE